jgi:hypothetical protein
MNRPERAPDFVCTRGRGCFRGSDLPLFDPPPASGDERAPQCTTVHHDASQGGVYASQTGVYAGDPCAGRHGGNPQSEAAHRRLSVSGLVGQQREWVLHQIRRAGKDGMTVDELSELATERCGREVPPNRISGRVSELKHLGLIRGTGSTRPTRTGTQAAVLVAIGSEP